MALTGFQRELCLLLAAARPGRGERYVAGGTALNLLAGGSRLSRDIDLFHDTAEALEASWTADRRLLEAHGCGIEVLHERVGYVEALVSRGADRVLVEWARDSAFRFFPLVTHEDLGLALHPFDLATNKVLALVGRLEVRDWIDVLTCHARIQPLGYLVWAACGKDPGFGPASLLEHAARTSRYVEADLAGLAFSGPPPDLGALSRLWHDALAQAARILGLLPPQEAGTCVLDSSAALYAGAADRLSADLETGKLLFHRGSIRGAFPTVAGSTG